MKSNKYLLLALLLMLVACKNRVSNISSNASIYGQFNPSDYRIGKDCSTKLIKGQVLYLPVYSNIPYHQGKNFSDLSAFLAIHNTDFYNSIRITKVQYIDNDGNLVKDYSSEEITLKPLAAHSFFVPSADKSGTGANFILEWVSDSLVTEPLVESVITGLTSGQGVSFISTGKILREVK